MIGKNKITDLLRLRKIVTKLKKEGKRVGLITGCFDILHIGHLFLFKKAKEQVDILLIGLENDQAIKLSKGNNRPFFKLADRLFVISQVESVDYIFSINAEYDFRSVEANSVHEALLKEISPDVLITHMPTDRYWEEKKKRAEKLGIGFRGFDTTRKVSSSSAIIRKLEEEF